MAKKHHSSAAPTSDVTAKTTGTPAQDAAPATVDAATANTSTATQAQPEPASPESYGIHNPHFWVHAAFLLFVILAVKYLLPKINGMLDKRSKEISDQLEMANRLRAEAEALVAASRQEREAMLEESKQILAQAELDVKELYNRAESDLAQAIIRRTAQADERITRAKTDALADLKRDMVETATDTARQVLIAQLQSEPNDPAIARALKTIAGKLH